MASTCPSYQTPQNNTNNRTYATSQQLYMQLLREQVAEEATPKISNTKKPSFKPGNCADLPVEHQIQLQRLLRLRHAESKHRLKLPTCPPRLEIMH
jgi:hypothetical protein